MIVNLALIVGVALIVAGVALLAGVAGGLLAGGVGIVGLAWALGGDDGRGGAA